eukprot:Pgem_evm1s524
MTSIITIIIYFIVQGETVGSVNFEVSYFPDEYRKEHVVGNKLFTSLVPDQFFALDEPANVVYKRNNEIISDPMVGPYFDVPPPVKRLHLAYGVGTPTEVSYAYRMKSM